MLLSIGMIVKNEEQYLEQCLTALKPILENVDSELIIADTGSTDNTVEIAKKFTDNVFYFEWINDFAAARNSTLDKARGEWYMYIDGDEIIKDATPIIEFFKSGEYKKYGSATYIIRSYNDIKHKDIYSDFRPLRLTALANGVRFIKPIHEIFNQGLAPCKNLEVIADHYGYVYKEDGEIIDGAAEKKTSRNLELLFQELEKGKETGKVDNMIYGQIVDCYYWLADYDNALKYIELGSESCPSGSFLRIKFINIKLNILVNQKKFDEVIELCKFYFSKENIPRQTKLVSDSGVYFMWAFANYNLNNYEEAINRAVLGFDVYRSYINGKLYTPELFCCPIETTIPRLKSVCNIFMIACIALDKTDIAAREIDSIPIKEFYDDEIFMIMHLAMRVSIMEKTNYNKLPDLYYKLDKPNRELYITALIRNFFKTEKREQFIKKLKTLSGESERLSDIIKLYSDYLENSLMPDMISEFIEKHGIVDNEIVWIIMMKKNFSITPFIYAKDFNKENIISVFSDFSNSSSALDLFTLSMNKLTADDVDKMLTDFYEAVRSATSKEINTSVMIMCLGRFGKRWVELHPKAEKSDFVLFSLKIGETAELHRKKNFDESIKQLEALIENAGNPDLENDNTKILQHYLKLIKDDKQKAADMLEHEVDPQMAELADQIKCDIRAMINEWNLNSAEELINEMARLVPFDPDIENIRDEITDRKINYIKYM